MIQRWNELEKNADKTQVNIVQAREVYSSSSPLPVVVCLFLLVSVVFGISNRKKHCRQRQQQQQQQPRPCVEAIAQSRNVTQPSTFSIAHIELLFFITF